MNGGFHPRNCVKRLMFQGRREEEVSSGSMTVLIKQHYCWRQYPIQWGGVFESSQEGRSWKPRMAASFKDRRRTENIQGWKEMPLSRQFETPVHPVPIYCFKHCSWSFPLEKFETGLNPRFVIFLTIFYFPTDFKLRGHPTRI